MDNPWQLCRTIGPLLSQRFPLASAKAQPRGGFLPSRSLHTFSSVVHEKCLDIFDRPVPPPIVPHITYSLTLGKKKHCFLLLLPKTQVAVVVPTYLLPYKETGERYTV